jgi:hypothetical protein
MIVGLCWCPYLLGKVFCVVEDSLLVQFYLRFIVVVQTVILKVHCAVFSEYLTVVITSTNVEFIVVII